MSETFPAVATSSWQRSQRSFVQSELARLSLPGTSPDEPVPQADEARAGWALRKLHYLTVWTFLGFRQSKPFELHKWSVMFFAPEWQLQKNILCEALEFALFGSGGEWDINRITPTVAIPTRTRAVSPDQSYS